MAKLKSFEQFLSEMDRASEVEQEIVAAAEPEERPEEESEEVQGNGEAIAESEEIKESCETEEVTEAEEADEPVATEKEVEETEKTKLVSDMVQELYEACKNEAKVWADDAHDEHTVETYFKENAALVAATSAKSLKDMKEDYTVEAFEAACNEMIEAYTKKVNEMKEVNESPSEEAPAE
jgi:hypothetical protein